MTALLWVQKPGNEMSYMYDLGDHWSHDIRLISLYPVEESTGRCQVCLSWQCMFHHKVVALL